MKDQMLIDKYNELGKAHTETVSQLAKKDEIIKELKIVISLLKQNVEGMSSFTFIELQRIEKKIEELENEQ